MNAYVPTTCVAGSHIRVVAAAAIAGSSSSFGPRSVALCFDMGVYGGRCNSGIKVLIHFYQILVVFYILAAPKPVCSTQMILK